MVEPQPVADQPWNRHHIRAPRGDETLCAVPDLADAAELARRNNDRLQSLPQEIQGRSLADVRDWARREVFRAARKYTAGWTDWCDTTAGDQAPSGGPEVRPTGGDKDDPPEFFFVSGHQPTLYHPGVWVKNFVVSELARREGSCGLNLVVDNDLFSAPAIRVPSGNREKPAYSTIAFDDPQPPQPFSGVSIENAELFRSFGERVAEAMAIWGVKPLAAAFWPAAVRHMEKSNLVVDCVTAARNQWEREWGACNLELPLSRLCQLESFLWFATHILSHLPAFHRTYNEVLGEYRVANKLRSRTHPVPDLREQDGWLEAPFWVWRTGDTLRKRVFARAVRQGDGRNGAARSEILLSDGAETFARLPLSETSDGCCAVEVLRGLPAQGIHFRTRALTTTLFTRLCFADLFVHGIGGAKYDEMTDRLLTRFFHVIPPAFLTLSATIELPLQPHEVQQADASRLRMLLRELDYNSDRHLFDGSDPQAQALIDEKQRLIAAQAARRNGPTQTHDRRRGRGAGYERLRRLQEIAAQLAHYTEVQRRTIEVELARTIAELNANTILHDREFSFCLYPAEKLQKFMTRVRNF